MLPPASRPVRETQQSQNHFCAFCAFLWLAFVKMAAFLNPA
jgi:hypothetical protein